MRKTTFFFFSIYPIPYFILLNHLIDERTLRLCAGCMNHLSLLGPTSYALENIQLCAYLLFLSLFHPSGFNPVSTFPHICWTNSYNLLPLYSVRVMQWFGDYIYMLLRIISFESLQWCVLLFFFCQYSNRIVQICRYVCLKSK